MESSPQAVHQRDGGDESSGAPLVREIADLWAEHLDCRRIEADDDFFELGGNSLIGIKIIDRIAQEYDVHLAVRDFYLAQSPARVATLVERGRAGT